MFSRVSMSTWSPSRSDGSDQNGLPAVTRWPAMAKLPSCPGHWVPGTCPGLWLSWARAVPWIRVNRHCWPKAGILMKAKAAGGHVELLGAGAEGVAAAARPLPLLVQLTCQDPLGGRGPEPCSPDQVANEEQPDQSYGQQDLPGSTGSVSHDPIHSSRYRRRVWSPRGTEGYLLVTTVAGKTPIAPATARSGYA